jgi:putative ABC transport system substrate-binding protein
VNRRTFLCGLTLGPLAAPLAVAAQQMGKVPRVGVYTSTPAGKDALGVGLRELGWIDGQNIAIDWRGAAAGEEAAQMEELARRHVDAVVLGGPLRIRAAMQATKTVPIIGIDLESDPVASGFAKSLARPATNVSGIWLDLPELAGKQLQFLREVLPAVNRVGVVWDDRVGGPQLAGAQSAARAANISLRPISVHTSAETETVVKRLLVERPQAILVLTAPVIFLNQARIADLAHESRLPSVSPFSTYPAHGGLMAYGPSFPAMWRQAASYVDRLLKGAKVGDLPIERPAKFELVINLNKSAT